MNQPSHRSHSRNPSRGGNRASSRTQPRAPLHGGNQAQASFRSQPRNPLHGIRLDAIVEQLVARHGWAEMGRRIPIRCFLLDPSINSSLTFLRRTPWARKRVEDWYIEESAKK